MSRYVETVADSFQNSDGGMAAIDKLAPVEINASTSGPQSQGSIDSTAEQPNREDPLFKAIAGDSNAFHSGIPKSVWDKMPAEERDRAVRGTEEERQNMGVAGATVGGALGAAASLPFYAAGPGVGGVASGALTSFGAAKGYNVGYNRYANATAPSVVSREELNKQFEEAKGRE